MRTFKFSDGREIQVETLSIGQMQKLRATEFAPIDYMFEVVEAAGVDLSPYESLPFSDLSGLSNAILAETYGLKEELKN